MAADCLTESQEAPAKRSLFTCAAILPAGLWRSRRTGLADSGDQVGLVGLFETTMKSGAMAAAGLGLHHRAGVHFGAAGIARHAISLTWPATLRKSAERLRAWRGTLGARLQSPSG